jgi:hypothetical protein
VKFIHKSLFAFGHSWFWHFISHFFSDYRLPLGADIYSLGSPIWIIC